MYFSLRYIFVCQCLHHLITSYFCKNDDLRQRFVKMRRLSQTWKQKRTSERSSNHVIKQRIPNVHQINDDKDCRRNSSKVRYIQEIHPLRYKAVIALAKLSIKVNLSRVTAFFLDLGFGVIVAGKWIIIIHFPASKGLFSLVLGGLERHHFLPSAKYQGKGPLLAGKLSISFMTTCEGCCFLQRN